MVFSLTLNVSCEGFSCFIIFPFTGKYLLVGFGFVFFFIGSNWHCDLWWMKLVVSDGWRRLFCSLSAVCYLKTADLFFYKLESKLPVGKMKFQTNQIVYSYRCLNSVKNPLIETIQQLMTIEQQAMSYRWSRWLGSLSAVCYSKTAYLFFFKLESNLSVERMKLTRISVSWLPLQNQLSEIIQQLSHLKISWSRTISL